MCVRGGRVSTKTRGFLPLPLGEDKSYFPPSSQIPNLKITLAAEDEASRNEPSAGQNWQTGERESKLPLVIWFFSALDRGVKEGRVMLSTQAQFCSKQGGGEMTAHTSFKCCTEVLRRIKSISPKYAIWLTATSEGANACWS